MGFQRKVGRFLRNEFSRYTLFSEQWIEYEDRNGRGFAQPDFYFISEWNLVVLEAKLTQKYSAITQIDELYRPLLRRIYRMPVVGIQVCKNLTKDPGKWQIEFPAEVLGDIRELTWTWHYLG